jgi:hypothetical protein
MTGKPRKGVSEQRWFELSSVPCRRTQARGGTYQPTLAACNLTFKAPRLGIAGQHAIGGVQVRRTGGRARRSPLAVLTETIHASAGDLYASRDPLLTASLVLSTGRLRLSGGHCRA